MGSTARARTARTRTKLNYCLTLLGRNNPVRPPVGGGLGAGKVTLNDLQVVKRTDKATPKLFLNCCVGTHIATGTLTVRKAGTTPQEYLVMTLTDIIVTNIQNGGSTSGDIPSETVSLNYSQLQITYQQQNADGTLAGTVKTGYNVKTNKSV